jgi:integrase
LSRVRGWSDGQNERWELRPAGSNPCRQIDAFPERRRTRFLSLVEIARLGQVLDEEEDSPFIVLAIRLLLLTGARRDEILTFRWDFVDFANSLLHLPDSKTGAKVISLAPPARALLQQAPTLKATLTSPRAAEKAAA